MERYRQPYPKSVAATAALAVYKNICEYCERCCRLARLREHTMLYLCGEVKSNLWKKTKTAFGLGRLA